MKEQSNLQTIWNVQDIFASEQEFLQTLQAIEEICTEIASLQGSLHTPEALLAYFQKNDALSLLAQKVYAYASCLVNENGENAHAHQLQSHVDVLFEKMSVQLAFVEPEILKNSVSFFRSLVKDVRFKNYDKDILDYIALKPHALSQQEAQVLSHFAGTMVSEDVQALLCDVEITFKPIWVGAKKVKVTAGNVSKLLQHPSRAVRMRANKSFKQGIVQFQKTLGASYIASVKNDAANARITNFTSTLQAELFSSELPENVYRALMQSVQQNKHVLQAFLQLYKQKLHTKTLYSHDVYATTLSRLKKDAYTYPQAVELVTKALSFLGPTYMQYVQKACKEGWIDVYPKQAKHSGGYCLDVFGVHPYILLNFNGKFDDVSTLAHEMGHAVHACLSANAQPISKHGHTLLTAETASVTNEILLTLYCIENTTVKEEKIFLTERLLKQMMSTLYTQVMYSQFEEKVHTMVESGTPITYTNLNEEFARAFANIFEPALNLEPFGEIKWAYIPHFYHAYYVFNYALGFLSALTIARKLRTDKTFISKYLQFLQAGESESPVMLFKHIGLDITDPHCFDEAFAECERLLQVLQTGGKV